MVDTGLVLRLRRVLDILDERLARLIAALGATRPSGIATTVIAARTRFQIATPTTLGAKIAVWALPLVRHRDAARRAAAAAAPGFARRRVGQQRRAAGPWR